MKRLLLIAVLGVTLLLAACGGDSPTAVQAPSRPPSEGLIVKDLETGSGPAIEVGDEIGVRYIAFHSKNGKEFENSLKLTFTFELGSGVANEGWERGLAGMRVGGSRELVVPSKLAFGEGGLTYVVHLVEVE